MPKATVVGDEAGRGLKMRPSMRMRSKSYELHAAWSVNGYTSAEVS